jgi:hypothetical protein
MGFSRSCIWPYPLDDRVGVMALQQLAESGVNPQVQLYGVKQQPGDALQAEAPADSHGQRSETWVVPENNELRASS